MAAQLLEISSAIKLCEIIIIALLTGQQFLNRFNGCPGEESRAKPVGNVLYRRVSENLNLNMLSLMGNVSEINRLVADVIFLLLIRVHKSLHFVMRFGRGVLAAN
jgi:hypothetical protein